MKTSSKNFLFPLLSAILALAGIGALLLSRQEPAAPSPVGSSTPIAAAQADSPVKHVFIISFDQMMPENVQAAEMPVLKQMAAEGAHTWEAYTIVPSLTLPSHVSMLTGVGVQKHQVLWNDFQPDKGRITVPTVFQLAKEQGLSTMIIAAKPKFKTFQEGGAPDVLIIPEEAKCGKIAETFAAEVQARKPHLCFIHFADPDSTGHAYGVRSPEKMQALRECDQALKTVRDAIATAGLADSSVILMSADHGGHDRSPQENAERAARGEKPQPGTHGAATRDDVLIPWIAWGAGVKPGHTITAPVVTYDTAATALWLLGIPLPEGLWGRPVTSAFTEAGR